ncbi:sigma-70 family RNA polymerase sigma factor [Parafrigoribacterium soli]|uniref:sigma-70 family RNA polymerase sigma factor n=1 Tax=Parafrigoribacterium soli TaxID=3144663 RepID=UPI0032EBAF19
MAATPSTEHQRQVRETILQHLDLANAIAHRYTGRTQDAEDIRQVAYLGLVKASQRFTTDKGEDFASFAVPTISGEIKRHLRDNAWFIRPPRPVQELRARLNSSAASLAQELGRTPTNDELARALGEDVCRVEEAEKAQLGFRPTSLDVPTNLEGNVPLADTIGGPDDSLERVELAAMLAPAIERLSSRDKSIVYLRFVEEKSQQEIASQLGVTQMQVSRQLAKILAALRASLAYGTRRHDLRASA